MKKGLLALLAITSFVACNRDENKTMVTQFDVVGVWSPEKTITFSGKDNSVLNNVLFDECQKKGSVEFTKDGKLIKRSFITNEGQCIENGTEEKGTYIYDASTKKITITFKGNIEEVKVISLTDTELQTIDRDDLDENKDGIMDKIITIFKKQK